MQEVDPSRDGRSLAKKKWDDTVYFMAQDRCIADMDLRPNRAVHRLAVMGFVRTTCSRSGAFARDWYDRSRTPTAAALPGLKASRSASMAVKATAHTEPHGSLWSTSFHLPAVGGRGLLAGADAKLQVSAMGAEAIGSCSNAIATLSTCG